MKLDDYLRIYEENSIASDERGPIRIDMVRRSMMEEAHKKAVRAVVNDALEAAARTLENLGRTDLDAAGPEYYVRQLKIGP